MLRALTPHRYLANPPPGEGGNARAGFQTNRRFHSARPLTEPRGSLFPETAAAPASRNALRGRKEGEHTFPLPPSLVNVFSVGRCLAPGFRRGHVGTLGPSREHPGGRQTRREALTLSVGRRAAPGRSWPGSRVWARLLGRRGLSESFSGRFFAPIWWFLEVNKVELIKQLAQCLAQNSFPLSTLIIIISHILRVHLDSGSSENATP